MRVSPTQMGSPFQRQSSGANLVKGSYFGRQSGNVGRTLCPGHIARLPKRVAPEQPCRSAGVSRRCVDPTPFVSACALKECTTVVSGFCKVVLTICVEGFDKHAGKFWKAGMKVFKQGMMSRKPGR